jgi:hypothetical protein
MRAVAVLLLSRAAAAAAPAPIPADAWAAAYRNWSYFPDYVIPPSCVDPATCAAPYINLPDAFTDCFTVWSVADPHAPVPPSPRYVASYIFYDGVGYQTAVAYSDDLVHFTQPLAPAGILFGPRTSWPAAPGEFDYGGADATGFLMSDYNVTAPRVLARAPGGRFWLAYFGQPTRGALEPPPGATGLASSADGFSWRRETPVPILDTAAAHGAGPWERVQIYAPFLVLGPNGSVTNFYNAKGATEQSGFATLPGGAAALPGLRGNASLWTRSAANPVLRNGAADAFDARYASDPKVFWDASLGDAGAWVMLYFGVGSGRFSGASICVAFSLDGVAWTKASAPLYLPGGHPKGLDAAHAHKAWLTVDATGRKYLYYTGAAGARRGILLLTSTPL